MRLKVFILLLLICVCVSGCSYEREVVERESEVLTFESNISSEFESNQTSVSETIPISDEAFSLVCTYDTRDYPLEDWSFFIS